MIAADSSTAVAFSLTPGQAGDAPAGRELLANVDWELCPDLQSIIMDRAYEGDETRQLVFELQFEPVVPPKSNRVTPWEYDRELYKKRNEVERLFRRLKGFRRIFARFDKLDAIFIAYIHLALAVDALFNLC